MGRNRLLATSTLLFVIACGGATPSSTVLADAPTTSPASTSAETTTPPANGTVEADHVFMMQDSGGNKVRQGPFLVSVYRPLGEVTPTQLVETLMDGPTAAETAAGISSAIPDVTMRSVSISDGVATVDLDQAFEQGGGSLLMTSRLAQLTYTLTAVDGVDGVRLRLGGQDVTVFSGEGIILDDPMTRRDFETLLPGILVESPGWGAPVADTFHVTGTAAVFEATFQWSLSVDGEMVIPPTVAMTDNGTGWGSFDIPVNLPTAPTGSVELKVWEESAEDGSEQSVRTIIYTTNP